jgi:hypothetical protein
MPPTRFGYTSTTGRYAQVPSSSFNLGGTALYTWDARHGVIAGDFNGDGKSDILRWDSRAGQTLTSEDQNNNSTQKRYVNHVWLANDKVPGKFDAAVNFSAPANTTTAADGTTSASLAQLGGPLGSSTGQYWEGIDTFAMDINGDGRADLVSLCKTSVTACPINRTRMWLSLTSSTDPSAADFGAFHELAIPPQGPKEVAADGTDTGRWVSGPLHTSSTQRSGECRPAAMGGGAGTWSYMELNDVFWQDMNSDGLVDIVSISYRNYSRSVSYQTGGPCIAGMGDYPSTTATLRYFQGRGDGTFVLKQSAPFTGAQRVWNENAKSGLSHVEVMDVDGDGRPDIVFRRTRWVQDGSGNFQQQVVAVDPSPQHGDYRMLALEANGDGRTDIVTVDPDATIPDPQGSGKQVSANPYAARLFVNRGDGTFVRDDRPIAEINKLGERWVVLNTAGQMKYGTGQNGSMALDFNGDGLTDFLPWVGDAFPGSPEPNTPYALRLYLAKGGTDAGKTNGTFPGLSTSEVTHGLPTDLVTNGFSFSGGDFLGLGSAGFLQTGNGGSNSLWYRWGAPADLLESVRSPLGRLTSVMYSSTGVATTGITGENNTPVTPAVYRNTRPVISRPAQTTPLEPTQVPVVSYPIQHSHPASWVVSRTTKDSGVNGVAGVTTAFLYRGVKLDLSSGGNLGYEAVSKYFPYANGGMLVTTSEYLQHPDQPQYQGLTRCTYTEYDPTWALNSVTAPIEREFDRNRRGTIPQSTDTTRAKAMSVSSETPSSTTACFDRDNNLSTGAARVISMTSYVYGDVQAQELGATMDRPAEVASLVKRPYQKLSTQRTWDLKSPSLLVSRVTTANAQLTVFGDVEKSEIASVGVGLPGGLGDVENKKVTDNAYELADPYISSSKWLLGRLKTSKVTSSTSTVAPATPNSSLLTAQQLATRDPALGATSPRPLAPAVLAAILQVLLDD